MLSVVVPGFVGRSRRQAIREPFADRAPGFSTYLRDERGLRDTTLGLYDEHLRAFASLADDLGRGESAGALAGSCERVSDRSGPSASAAQPCGPGVRYSACFSAICTVSG